VRHEEQQGQGLFVLKCGFGLPVWRVLPAWVRLLFVRFAGGAVRLAACAFCWPKDKSRVVKGWGCCCMLVKGWGCCCMLVLCGMAQGEGAGGLG
jgi:hypothetical protein